MIIFKSFKGGGNNGGIKATMSDSRELISQPGPISSIFIGDIIPFGLRCNAHSNLNENI